MPFYDDLTRFDESAFLVVDRTAEKEWQLIDIFPVIKSPSVLG